MLLATPALAAEVTEVTVTGIEVVNNRAAGSTATLRFYYSETFVAKDGRTVVGGLAGSPGYYTTAACTVSSSTVTCASATLKVTTTSSRPSARMTIQLWDGANRTKLADLYSNLQIPPDYGATVSIQSLVAYNQSRPAPLGDGYPNRSEVAAMVTGQVNVGNPAKHDENWRERLHAPPTDPAAPEVVVTEDPRLAAASPTNRGTVTTTTTTSTAVSTDDTRLPTQGENDALAGTSGTPSSSNKYVTNADVRLNNNCVRVGDYATAGDGTAAHPWTGWDTAITWAERKTYCFNDNAAGTLTVYAYSTSPNFAKNNIRLIGTARTFLKFTGSTGPAFKIDGTGEASGTIGDLHMENFIIDGGGAAVDGLYIRGSFFHHVKNVVVRNLSGDGFHVLGSPGGYYDTPTVSEKPGTYNANLPAITANVANNMKFERDINPHLGALDCNASTIVNPIL